MEKLAVKRPVAKRLIKNKLKINMLDPSIILIKVVKPVVGFVIVLTFMSITHLVLLLLMAMLAIITSLVVYWVIYGYIYYLINRPGPRGIAIDDIKKA